MFSTFDWLGNELVVCLYEIGQSFPHESAFEIELDSSVISLYDSNKNNTFILIN